MYSMEKTILSKTCEECGKVIESMYIAQLETNYAIHKLTHKKKDKKKGETNEHENRCENNICRVHGAS